MNTIDLSFYLEPPQLDTATDLQLEGLAPLSLVSDQPGSYFRSAVAPSAHMILGMLENALGWHFDDQARNALFKSLTRLVRKGKNDYPEFQEHPWFSGATDSANSSYRSLLQFHIELTPLELPPIEVQYDDLWSMLLRDNGINFIGGSRHYSGWLEDIINLSKREDREQAPRRTGKHPTYVSFGDRKEYVKLSLEELKNLDRGLVNTTSLSPYFPMYYSSPRKRGYVLPAAVYKYRLQTTEKLAALLLEALQDPAAPLYLGTNDGWIEAKMETL